MPRAARHRRWRSALHAAAAVAAAIMLATAVPGGIARAQLSPGRLARPHAGLEGVKQCLSCHDRKREAQAAKCLACHREIAWLIERGRGLHGGGATPGGAGGNERTADPGAAVARCAGCHPEHGGRSFALIAWPDGGPAAFDHRRAGYALDGKHTGLACARCHLPRLQVAAFVTKDAQLRSDTWLGLERACGACHNDPHAGRLGPACASCHSTAGFHEIREKAFDHDRTDYPLRGRHATLECRKCHDAEAAWGARPAHATCASCHADPHAGRATLAGRAADCAACHAVEGFRPALFSVARHRETAFPLAGRHARVACAGCHRREPAPAGGGAAARSEAGAGGEASARPRAAADAAGVVMHPAHERCEVCHDDPHVDDLRAAWRRRGCAGCHTVTGWSPSTFTTADHAGTAFALEGAHARSACAACHGPERPGRAAPPDSAAGRRPGGRRAAGVALRLEAAECTACHRDPHGGRFALGGDRPLAAGCAGCHDAQRFRPSRVDAVMHERFAYALAGAHRSVACIDCHAELGRPPAASTLAAAAPGAAGDAGGRGHPEGRDAAGELTFRTRGTRCADCHADRHGGQFAERADGGDCAACHDLRGFAPAARFDHERDSSFALEAAHARVACGRCHQDGLQPDATIGPLYRPLATQCADCHLNGVGGTRRSGGSGHATRETGGSGHTTRETGSSSAASGAPRSSATIPPPGVPGAARAVRFDGGRS